MVNRNLRGIAEASSSLFRQSTDQAYILRDLEDTIALGSLIGSNIPRLSILGLYGPLGAGKTSLVKGIARALGIGEEITSPTFSLSHHYQRGKQPLVHLDLYRLEDPKDADELFFQEEENAKDLGALMAIEWPERLGIDLREAWHLHLEYAPDESRIAYIKYPSNGF